MSILDKLNVSLSYEESQEEYFNNSDFSSIHELKVNESERLIVLDTYSSISGNEEIRKLEVNNVPSILDSQENQSDPKHI